MVRTERLAVTGNRDGMLIEVPSRSTTLEARDLDAYLALQAVARAVDYGDTMEFWKSAPYLLNFMDDYALKHAVAEAAEDPERRAALAAALGRHPGGLLSWQDIVQYSEIDPANARLRGLLADTVDMGAWQLLWIPSALSYYRASGPYASEALRGLTKRLVFSSWRVVPRVIASLLSYAAERRMIRSLEDSPENTPDARRRRT